jgi:hypothetical protein
MRFETLIAALLMLSQASSSATAEPRNGSSCPQFSGAETRTVGRNELLQVLIESDPWLVRQILDAVAQRTVRNSDAFVARALDGIDRKKNPDIVSATRTAAASIEWIGLLRQARAEKEAVQPPWRSAEGSVELIEMLKRAKQEKPVEKNATLRSDCAVRF